MRRHRARRPVNAGIAILLILATAALTYANWRIWRQEFDTTPILSQGDTSLLDLSVRDDARYEETPIDLFAAIVERPVFSPSRRPFVLQPQTQEAEAPRAAPEPAPVAVALSQFQLLGVLFADNEWLAFVQSPSATDGTWLGPGATLDGWTLQEISENSAVFESSGRTAQLQLYVDNLGITRD